MGVHIKNRTERGHPYYGRVTHLKTQSLESRIQLPFNATKNNSKIIFA
jgi:hypothetical protein